MAGIITPDRLREPDYTAQDNALEELQTEYLDDIIKEINELIKTGKRIASNYDDMYDFEYEAELFLKDGIEL